MIFNSAKKIQELQDNLAAKCKEIEELKAKLATAEAEVEAVNKVMEPDKEKDAEEDDEEEMEEGAKAAVVAQVETESPADKVSALIQDHQALQAEVTNLKASIPAQVSSVLAKMGIDPIHANKGTNDGTKDKPASSNKKGISRAAELLNEKAKR